jgi:hypothetical protein
MTSAANLNTYLGRTKQIIYDLKEEVVPNGVLIQFINEARGQIAVESQCLRGIGMITLTIGTNSYQLSSISNPSVSGYFGAINIRNLRYLVGSGSQMIYPRSFEWFTAYELNTPVLTKGAPITWSMFKQGIDGIFYISPVPDIAYTIYSDSVYTPADLDAYSDTEVLPHQWNDAVPYYAAYLSYLFAQEHQRAQDLMQVYKSYMSRAITAVTPTVLPTIYQNTPNPSAQQAMGIQTRA